MRHGHQRKSNYFLLWRPRGGHWPHTTFCPVSEDLGTLRSRPDTSQRSMTGKSARTSRTGIGPTRMCSSSPSFTSVLCLNRTYSQHDFPGQRSHPTGLSTHPRVDLGDHRGPKDPGGLSPSLHGQEGEVLPGPGDGAGGRSICDDRGPGFICGHLVPLGRVPASTNCTDHSRVQLQILMTGANDFPVPPELMRAGLCLLSADGPSLVSLVSPHGAKGRLLRGCCPGDRCFQMYRP